jgi:hypothetical protein
MRSKVMLAAGLLLLKAASAHAQAFTEDFNDITTLPAAGWVQTNHSQPIGTISWFQGNSAVFPAQTGAPTAYIGVNFNSGGGTATISNWLLTPPATLVNGATISFWTRTISPSTFPDRLQVRMSTNGNSTNVGTTATDVGDFTTLLLDINPNLTTTGYPLAWTQFTVPVTGVPAPLLGRLAFRYFVTNGGPNGSNSDYIGIDTVAFTPGTVPATVAPASLAVDTAGNGVMQPNETVTVTPSWMNTSTVAITNLTGTLGTFTGPAGATYTVNDGTAVYGPIAPSATAPCTDCYAVTAAAATRPITHWDTTAVETVSTGSTAKTWTLHVGNSFTDVPPSSGFYKFIETIVHKNVTGGCGTDTYCPSASTTRAQMAVFVLVAKEPAGFNPPNCVAGSEVFSDVPASSPFCKWVEELFRRGVVSGCGNGQFCTNTPAARDAMAVFVLRTLLSTLNPPNCVAGSEMFADVPASNPFCKWIEELVRRGVVSGCGGGNYCPTANVTREQMAVFLTVTFGLTLYGL